MLGGDTSSKITVQGSSDGSSFHNIEDLIISGSQNDVLSLQTTKAFAATDRYVKLLFTKGSNVGVGPISIAKYEPVSITPAKTYTTLTSDYALDFTGTDIRAFIVLDDDASDGVITMTEVTKVPANTGLVLKAATTGTAINVSVLNGDADNVTGNLMAGSATTTTAITENGGYILKDGKFHPATAGTLAAGKAYLNLAVPGAGAPALTLNFGDLTPTGISRIENGEFLRPAGSPRGPAHEGTVHREWP